MNKVYGKTNFTQKFKTDFPFKSYDKKLVFLQRMGSFLLCWAQGKKTFFSQSVRSTFGKRFTHVLLVVQGKILRLKMQKNIYFFIWAS
jgi:hypothetical protein